MLADLLEFEKRESNWAFLLRADVCRRAPFRKACFQTDGRARHSLM